MGMSWPCLHIHIYVGLYTVPGTSIEPTTLSHNTGEYSFQFMMVCLSVFCKTKTPPQTA